MQQRFFENTLISKFIKYLLSYTPLPLYPTISSDDYIIEGCLYIYKDKILRCTQSGRFNGINANQYIDDHLYVNEWVYTIDEDRVMPRYNSVTRDFDLYLPDGGKGFPSTGNTALENAWPSGSNGVSGPGEGGLTVTDDVVRQYYRPVATYEIVGNYNFGASYPNTTETFVSNVSYYDPDTHRMLGTYLRCLRDIYGMDLMSLYNCFDYHTASNFQLVKDASNKYISQTSSSTSNVFLIPIHFNRTYTIAMDCSFPVLMKAVIYDDIMIQSPDGSGTLTDVLTDNGVESIVKFNNMQFSNPVTYTLENIFDIQTTDQNIINQKKQLQKLLQTYEKYLYLAIQIPKSNTSSIVVLEGDYSSVAERYVSDVSSMSRLSDKELSRIFSSNLSLLEANTEEQIPFSDKLISYLLRYTIDNRDYIDDNVANIETKIGYSPDLENFYKGQWDNQLRYALYKGYMDIDNADYMEKLDILGFVDRDIEDAVWKGLIKYGS